LALGKTVAQLLTEIDSAELTQWQAFYQLEPFGSLIDDQRHGVAVATLANVNRNAKSHPEPYKAEDFISWRKFDRVIAQPELLMDPQAQSELILQKVFKIKT
jgi:hypothetical protein